MFGSRTAWRQIACLVGGLCVAGALSLTAPLPAATEAAPPAFRPAPPADREMEKKDKDQDDNGKKNGKQENNKEATRGLGTAVPPDLAGVPVLDLSSCKSMALIKQPAIASAHASYNAAVARQHALDTVRVPHFLARDLPIRKSQAAIGVNAAALEIQRVQLDTIFSVEYGYVSAQYAAEQRLLLETSRERLLKLREGVQAGIKAGKTTYRKEDVQRVDTYLNVLDSRLEEAIQGEQRAMSALREALGIDPYSPLIIRATGQFRITADLTKEHVVSLALARRPEIQQATLLSQVHALEVDAQGTRRLFPTAPTFASGSDIHARPLPAGSYEEFYRPAAVGPDMPVTINGCDAARAEVARAYRTRSGTMVEKTKNLIALETEQAYLRYVEGCKKLPRLAEAVRNAQVVFEATDSAFKKGERTVTARDWLTAGSTVTELKSQVNQARYQMLIALAGLERATACGYQPGFELAPTTDPPEPERPKEKKEDNGNGNGNDKEDDKLDPVKLERISMRGRRP